ncbi:unnamed protein product [Ceutorhynchus assimilis]|uniref:Uncharacterized protein n=1 Tax=Ceutorhynchus assimilis TaxID=467358 RepID=A0A9N9QR83_9CUCU|nr:unnamed protein product [Ceutorhynchus assimilis]
MPPKKANPEQYKKLVDLVWESDMIRWGAPEMKKEAWQQISKTLNCIGGAEKTAERWKKKDDEESFKELCLQLNQEKNGPVFSEWEAKVKAKTRRIHFEQELTGGGIPIFEILTNLEKKLLENPETTVDKEGPEKKDNLEAGSGDQSDTDDTKRAEQNDKGGFQVVQTSKKRRRVQGESPDFKEINDIRPRDNLTRLKSKVTELIKFCQETQNVHKTIKSLAKSISSLVECTIAEYKTDNFERKLEKGKQRQTIEDIKIVYEEKDKIKDETIDQLRQLLTEIENKTCSCKRTPEETIDSIEEKDTEIFEDIENLLNLPWASKAFKTTIEVERSNMGRRPNHLILFSSEEREHQNTEKKSNKLEEEIVNLFPELLEEEPTLCEGGFYTTLEENSTYRVRATNKTISNRKTTSIVYKPKSDELLKNLFRILKEINKYSQRQEQMKQQL